jgi:YD repeat-containing protein
VTQTYNYPAASNQLASITQTGAGTRSFGYDASGDRSSDTLGAAKLSAQYDGHGRLMNFTDGAGANGLTVGTYSYDGFARLVQRVVSNVAGASGTTNYYYDEFGHVVLETDGSGNSLREYIWLGDMPVAIIDEVDTTAPVLYYVHADHLNRPIMVTNAAGEAVWQAVWKPRLS